MSNDWRKLYPWQDFKIYTFCFDNYRVDLLFKQSVFHEKNVSNCEPSKINLNESTLLTHNVTGECEKVINKKSHSGGDK